MDPVRVREARLKAGLSLAQLAGDDVSRTFLHFVEHGRSRPSKAVLSLIARRTGKPITYFMHRSPSDTQPSTTLASELSVVADHVRQFGTLTPLTNPERQAIKLIELTLRQAAKLTKSIQSNSSHGRSKRS